MSKMDQTVTSLNQTVNSYIQTMDSHSLAIAEIEAQMGSMVQAIAKLKAQMEQIVNQIEEYELWSQSYAIPKEQYVIDDDASSNSHDELIQTNIPLRSERIIDNEMEEKKNELVLTFEPPKDPIPHPAPFEMEYAPKDPFLQNLEVTIEKVGVKLNIFHAAQTPLFKNAGLFLNLF